MLEDVVTSLDTYFKQCSMMVTARSLANLGAVLANGGVRPWDNKRIILDEEAYCIKSLMMTTGLYNQSGTYSRLIGVQQRVVLVVVLCPLHLTNIELGSLVRL